MWMRGHNTCVSVPTEIGRYRVRRRLGSGAFATVWLADDDALESSVAIKVLADNWAHHPDVRARFEQEGQILRRADSDRLVRVLDIGELPDGRPYLVMTYASGGTLAERLATGPIPVTTALRIATEIARAVAVLHAVGVLHRDLKPSNVLFHDVGGQERILVADLGLAKAIAHASGFTVVAGSPGYMAPEQATLGAGLDVRADVHAIGVMAYQMLTGRMPHPTAPAGTVPAPAKLRSALPAHVDQAVLRALQPDPERRWPSVDAFRTALEAPARPPRRFGAAHRLAAAGAATALTLAIGGSVASRSTAPGWVRLGDASDAVSLAVPLPWARQVRNEGWDPARVRLPGGHAPGLVVGGDLHTWANPDSGDPGVFIGLFPTAAESPRDGQTGPALPVHAGCLRQPDRDVTAPPLAGRVQRWTACAGTPLSYSEVVLRSPQGYGVYVQIKQTDRLDRTDQILDSVRTDRAYS
jgi:hypothetical protein